MALKYVLEKETVTLERKAFSVTEITRNIRLLLEQGFTNVWVEGEISNFKRHTSGHMYFSLKDSEAHLSAVMFRQNNHSLPFEPEDGMQVVCFGRISVWAPRGQYQLYVERIEPKGLGALQMRFQQLQERLRREGLFDEARKRPIPFLARRIAVVTSADGAALRDILNVLARRFSSANLLICPVPVQGAQASGAIAEAVDDLNALQACDVMILARGGGSLEDLWAFNEEVVARSIFRSAIPVISAVGHETDFTIADFVADLRAPTPSAAAEIVLPRREDLLVRIAELRSRAKQALRSGLEDRMQALDEIAKGFGMLLRNFVLSKKEKAARLSGKLEALGPLATLNRGFSVTMKGGQIVTRARSVREGDIVRTRLKDGSILSRITEVEHGG